MCFQEQEERLQQLEKELSELLQILPDTEELLMLLEEKTDPVSYTHLDVYKRQVLTVLPSTIGRMSLCTPSRETSGPPPPAV